MTKVESKGDGRDDGPGHQARPDQDQSRRNVTAAILPKTLFGEKYVELQHPRRPVLAAAAAPATRSTQTKMPIEVERVLNDLYPLLRTVQPAELNYTLNALADALEGRGEQDRREPGHARRLPQADEPAGAGADRRPQAARQGDRHLRRRHARARRDPAQHRRRPGNTLVSKEAEAATRSCRTPTAFSDTATQFLDANGDNIIRLGQLSEPILALLARYSGTFPCLLERHRQAGATLADTFRGFIFHINLQDDPEQPRGYTAADRPVYGADNAPNCAGLPNPPSAVLPRGRAASRTSTTADQRTSARATTSARPPASAHASRRTPDHRHVRHARRRRR